jgi:hypothetical protein
MVRPGARRASRTVHAARQARRSSMYIGIGTVGLILLIVLLILLF